MVNKPKIKPEERDRIAFLLASKTSLRDIAKALGRSVSSISEEVRRNSIKGGYTSIAAQGLSEQRNIACRRTNPLKNPKIYSYVFTKLRCGWSPEQIAGRLKKENNNKTVITHETIYRYIYSPEGMKRNLSEYLVRHHYTRIRCHSTYLYRRAIAITVIIRLPPT